MRLMHFYNSSGEKITSKICHTKYVGPSRQDAISVAAKKEFFRRESKQGKNFYEIFVDKRKQRSLIGNAVKAIVQPTIQSRLAAVKQRGFSNDT